MRLPRVHSRLSLHELPNVTVEATELFLQKKERFRIGYSGSDLELVADDSRIAQQLLNLAAVVTRNYFWVKFIERRAIVLALVKDRIPAQARLRAFEDEKFEQCAVVMNWNAPFFIVIRDRQFVRRPATANRFFLPLCVRWVRLFTL